MRLASSSSITLGLVLLSSPALAQNWPAARFSERIDLTAQSAFRTTALAAADLDGDGDTDLVVAAGGRQRVLLYEAVGGGAFLPPRTLADGLVVPHLLADDVDGDGDVDLVMSAGFAYGMSSPIAGLFWLENLGGSTFAATPERVGNSPAQAPSGLTLGDLDGNGTLDAVTIDLSLGTIETYPFLGGGFLGPRTIGTTASFGPRDVTVADFDGDGRRDVLVAYDDEINLGGGALWYRNTPTGFLPGVGLGVSGRAFGIAAADIEGDGDMDVIVGDASGVSISINLGGGSVGSFPLQIGLGGGVARPGARDLDGNGILDLTGTATFGDRALWAPGLGGNAFGAAMFPGPFRAASAWADIDGNGTIDLVYGITDDQGLEWSSNDGTGTFGAPTSLESPALESPSDVLLEDLDLDGDLDALIAATGNGTIAWCENVGGTFSAPRVVGQLNPVRRLAVGDLDGDGDVDVLASGTRAVWFARTGGSYGPARQLLGDARDAVPADLDGDGDLDVLMVTRTRIAWRRNVAPGTFDPAQTILTKNLEDRGDVEAADLDGDGDPDIVAVGNVVDRIVVVENTGGATFGPETILSFPFQGAPATRVAARDVDADGIVDVLAGGGGYYWLRGLGGGAYETFRFAGFFGSDGAGFATPDVDGDGDLDFVTCYDNNGSAVVLRTLESGLVTSGGRAITESQLIPQAVAAGDVDGDGDPDVVVASNFDDTVALYLNHVRNFTQYCSPNAPNQTGASGRIDALGSPSSQTAALRLRASSLPSNSAGFFLNSMSPGFATMPGGSRGNLCLSGSIGRYVGPGQVLTTGPFGSSFELALDPAATPTPTGFVAVAAGETWYFQAWYRDSFQGAATSNFTDGIQVLFD